MEPHSRDTDLERRLQELWVHVAQLREVNARMQVDIRTCAERHPQTMALLSQALRTLDHIRGDTRSRLDIDRADDAAAREREKLESRIASLEKFQWKIIGFAAGGGLAGASVVEGVLALFGK